MVKSAWAGSVVYSPGGRFGPRIQQDKQMIMLYTGEMNVKIDERELHVEPGNVLLLKPGHEETFLFSKTEETWHRWISIHVPHLNSDQAGISPEQLVRLFKQSEGCPPCTTSGITVFIKQ